MQTYKIEIMATEGINNKRKPIGYEIDTNGCWNCVSHSSVGGDGYPKLKLNRKTVRMSRYMYERYVDIIPTGLMIRHKCDNRKCINPEHLETGTAKDNVHDMIIRRNANFCGVKGEAHGASKLKQIQVDAIRKDTRIYKFIAAQYKISVPHVSDIKNNKTWVI